MVWDLGNNTRGLGVSGVGLGCVAGKAMGLKWGVAGHLGLGSQQCLGMGVCLHTRSSGTGNWHWG